MILKSLSVHMAAGVLLALLLVACGPRITETVSASPSGEGPTGTATSATPQSTLSPTPTATPSPTPSPTPTPEAPTLLAAGDIVSCSRDGHERTAEILDRHPDAVVQTLGDNAYNSGTPEQFECYDESWGRAYDRTRPALGGHDYFTEDAAGHMAYFQEVLEPMGESALDPRRGWYAYDLGAWRIYVLNSICDEVEGGCEEDSPQIEWLVDDLAANPRRCIGAVIHNPRFSSGRKGNEDDVEPMWSVLHDAAPNWCSAGTIMPTNAWPR